MTTCLRVMWVRALDSSTSEWERVAGCCYHGDEHSCSIHWDEFLDYL